MRAGYERPARPPTSDRASCGSSVESFRCARRHAPGPSEDVVAEEELVGASPEITALMPAAWTSRTDGVSRPARGGASGCPLTATVSTRSDAMSSLVIVVRWCLTDCGRAATTASCCSDSSSAGSSKPIEKKSETPASAARNASTLESSPPDTHAPTVLSLWAHSVTDFRSATASSSVVTRSHPSSRDSNGLRAPVRLIDPPVKETTSPGWASSKPRYSVEPGRSPHISDSSQMALSSTSSPNASQMGRGSDANQRVSSAREKYSGQMPQRSRVR